MLRAANSEACGHWPLSNEAYSSIDPCSGPAPLHMSFYPTILRHFWKQSVACRPVCGPLALCCQFRPWARSLKNPYNPVAARQPWISYPATEFLRSRLSGAQSVFEYGGGGSTLYFLDRGFNVTTAEHNPEWFDRIKSLAPAAGQYSRWAGILREPINASSEVSESDPSDPDAYVSSGPRYCGCSFRDYARAIDSAADESFDLVVVDGRARPSCVKHAVAKVKHQGYLLLDNTERPHYLTSKLLVHLSGFKSVFDCYGPVAGLLNFSRTTIWFKTCS